MCCTSMCIKRPLILLAVVLVPIVVLCTMGVRSEAHLDLGIDQFRLSNQDCRQMFPASLYITDANATRAPHALIYT